MKKILIICAAAALTGCGIYKPYTRPEVKTDGLYGTAETADTTTIGNLGWEEMFTDPYLRTLIRQGLENNTDLQSAQWRIKEAEATLKSARLAYLPSFNFAPQGSMSSFDWATPGKTYSIPVTASWQIDIFNGLTNAKRKSKALYLQSKEYEQAVKTQLISGIANLYYTLLMLDGQYEVTEQTAGKWRESVRTMRALKEAGMANEAAVAQYERSLAQAQNALNLVVGAQVPADLEPNNLEEATNYGAIAPAGLSSDILLNRPDIKAAEHNLMSANANIGAARANFFPRITLTAGIGSTSRHLSDLFDAGTGLWTFAPSVSLPIFTGGANLSTLRQAEAQQKIMVATYEKTVQNAFAEVSDALATVGTVNRQCAALKDLVNATETAYRLSQSRYKNGLDGFLTVLESQRQMVAAQTNYISAESNRLSSGVMLYKVLGGGSVVEPEAQTAAQAVTPAAAEPAQTIPVSSGGGNA